MTTGTNLVDLANELLSHLQSVRVVPNGSKREDMLVNTNQHLSASIDKLMSLTQQQQTTINTQQSQLSAKDGQIAAVQKELEDAKAADTLTEAEKNALIAKIEALTGPVTDPSDTVAGGGAATVEGPATVSGGADTVTSGGADTISAGETDTVTAGGSATIG